jgi:transcriptional regulator with XRE-family HTH domain
MDKPEMTFGELVGKWRNKHEPPLTQAALAEKLHISRSGVLRIENNKPRKSGYTSVFVAELADILGVSGLTREELFAAAGLLPDSEQLSPDEERLLDEVVWSFYGFFSIFPCFVHDIFFDFHSFNSYIFPLFGTTVNEVKWRFMNIEFGNNILSLMFDPLLSFRDQDEDRWREGMLRDIYAFRIKTRKYQQTPRYKKLTHYLAQFPDFQKLWKATQDRTFSVDTTKRGIFKVPPLVAPNVELLISHPYLETYYDWIQDRVQMWAYIPSEEKGEALLNRIRHETEYKIYRVITSTGLIEIRRE